MPSLRNSINTFLQYYVKNITQHAVYAVLTALIDGNERVINILEITWYMDMKNVTLVPPPRSRRRRVASLVQSAVSGKE
jgi:hypothetical protein